jgi:hypothetical protein
MFDDGALRKFVERKPNPKDLTDEECEKILEIGFYIPEPPPPKIPLDGLARTR